MDRKTYVLSTYFTQKEDPQRHTHWEADKEELVHNWYYGLGNAQGIIFYDELSSDFIKKFNSKVDFLKVETPVKYSTNDERFILFYSYINRFLNTNDVVFMTDLFDVTINRIPDIPLNDSSIYVSDECDHVWDNTFSWSVDQIHKCFNGELPKELKGKQLLNPGVWGGEKHAVSTALAFIIKEFEDRCVGNLNCNFVIFNYVLRNYFEEVLKIGYPLNSKFNHYEVNSDACFIHK